MKPILSVLLTLVLCLSLFACGKHPVETPTEPPTEAPTAAPTEPATEPPTEVPTEAPTQPEVPEVWIADSAGSFNDVNQITLVKLQADLPVCPDMQQIHDYYRSLLNDLQATCKLTMEDAARQKAEAAARGEEFIPWVVEVKSDIVRNDGKTLSVLREVYEHFGGPYPTVSCQAETFDVATQGRLLLSDLFQPGADYLSRLPVAEPDQLNFALTDNSLLCFDGDTEAVLLADLSDILLPQYLSE